MAPSLLQTLLRQPSQSYSTSSSAAHSRTGTPSPSLYDVSYSRSPSSSRRPSRTQSLRSGYSGDSSTSKGDVWNNGQWDWSKFGGRAGLTGGPSSIHPSEVASALGVPGESRRSRRAMSEAGDYSGYRSNSSTRAPSVDGGDTRSLRSHRSSRSMQSTRTTASTSSKQLGNTAQWTQGGRSLPLGAPSPKGKNGTSRSYSNLAPAAPSSTTSSRPSSLRHSSSQSPSRPAADSPGSEVPSLNSSISSAPSSPPVTPISSIAPPLEVRKSKRSSSSRRREMESVAEGNEDGMGVLRREDSLKSKTQDALNSFAAPTPRLVDPSLRKTTAPLQKSYYSVDEFFALAAPVPTPVPFPASASISSGEQEAGPEAVKETVLNDSIAQDEGDNVPRIRLTRTESDQDASGFKGDITIGDGEEDEASALGSAPANVSRKSSKSSSKRRSIVEDKPSTTIEVITTPTSRTRTSSAPEPASPTSGAAAADTPQWLSRIRALGEPIEAQSLVVSPSKKSKAMPQPHWTVQQYAQQQAQQQQAPRRPASMSNMRRRPADWELEPMPEMDEDVVEKEEQKAPVAVLMQPGSASHSRQGSRSGSRSSSGERRPSSDQPARRPASLSDSPPRRTSSSSERAAHPMPPNNAFFIPPPSTQTLPFAIPSSSAHPRAMSAISDAPSAYSASGYSTMSMPTGAFSRPPKNPQRMANRLSAAPKLSAEAAASGKEGSGMMSTLSVGPAALARPSAGGASGLGGIFKRVEPPLSSSQAHARKFDAGRDLVFGAIAPPPKKVGSSELLVEVFAVGLEQIDVSKARDMAAVREGFGFVPGRAFYGKVVETGLEVSRLSRGDLVFGMTTLKKSSALSELVVVHRDRVALAPINAGLDVEEVAALPSAAACALQVMAICRDLPKGSKIFVLQAHTGIGYLCLQLAAYLRPARDLYVVAHCPASVEDGVLLCKQAGASHVITDEPLAALNSCHEAEFDVVVDNIGGRRIYDASRRVLHHSGAFITTLSTSASSPSSAEAVTSTSGWKASMRSLRRAFIKKDKKLLRMISVWPETIDERGESPREVLERVKDAVEKGGLRARVDKVWSFREAAGAFKDGETAGVVRVKEV